MFYRQVFCGCTYLRRGKLRISLNISIPMSRPRIGLLIIVLLLDPIGISNYYGHLMTRRRRPRILPTGADESWMALEAKWTEQKPLQATACRLATWESLGGPFAPREQTSSPNQGERRLVYPGYCPPTQRAFRRSSKPDIIMLLRRSGFVHL